MRNDGPKNEYLSPKVGGKIGSSKQNIKIPMITLHNQSFLSAAGTIPKNSPSQSPSNFGSTTLYPVP